MLFLHLIADYNLQGILALMKQKSYWDEANANAGGKYKNDYIISLIEHAYVWTFMIMLPYMIFVFKNYTNLKYHIIYVVLFMINWAVHTYVDDLKANKMKINLVVDQLIHVVQILITCIVIFLFK
jgi:hypothetical protein